MAKLQVYKFVNSGVASVKTPSVVAAKQTLLAKNRFGKTLEGVGSTVIDLDKITNLRLGIQTKADEAERQQKQKERDAASEEVTEEGLSKYFKDKGKLAEKFKPDNKLKKSFAKMFGWVGPALGPFVELATKIFALQIITKFLEWTKDEENLEKLELFLCKTDFVFRKIYGFGKWLIKDNIVAGIEQLFGDDSTLLGRIGGLGKLMTGIIGLKYLMNPFSIITDIMFLANIISAGNLLGASGKCLPRSKINAKNRGPLSRSRRIPTTSGGTSTGRLGGVRDWFRKTFKSKPNVTGGKPNLAQRFTNLFKQKPKITGNVQGSGRFFSDLFKIDALKKTGTKFTDIFKQKPKVTGNTNIKQPLDAISKRNLNNPNFSNTVKNKGLVQNLKNIFNPKNFKNIKVTPAGVAKGVGTLGIGIAVDAGINKVADEIINKPLAKLIDNASKKKVEERYLNLGLDKTKEYYQNIINEESKKKPLNKWVNMATLGYGRIFVGPKTHKIEAATKALNYVEEISTTNVDNFFNKKKDKPKKKKGLFGLGFLGLSKGGKLPEYFLGGIFRAAKRVVSGVVNTVTSVAKKAWNVVSDVASNPIVSTVASFIPGANVIVPAINAVNALSSGNIAGAAMSALGGISNFSAIGSTARSVVETPNWLMNLRMSKFGQGISNAYKGATNFLTNVSGKVSSFFDMARNSTIGKIGMKIYTGNIGGAIGEVVGMMPGVSTNIEKFGEWLEKNQLSGILGAVPGIGGIASKVPNILAIPGMESILGKPGEGFSALGAIGNMADKVGMRGVYQAIISGAQTGNYIEGLPELAAEIGVDPRILGVLDKGKQLLQNNQFNAEYAMQTAIEFLPVPLVIEKIVAAPTPVPINSGDSYLVAPSSTNSDKR